MSSACFSWWKHRRTYSEGESCRKGACSTVLTEVDWASTGKQKNGWSSARSRSSSSAAGFCCVPAGWSLHRRRLLLPLKPNTAAGPTEISRGLINTSRNEKHWWKKTFIQEKVLLRDGVVRCAMAILEHPFSLLWGLNPKGNITELQQRILKFTSPQKCCFHRC